MESVHSVPGCPCVRSRYLTPASPAIRPLADVYANVPSVWSWINSTVFALTGGYLNEPFTPKTGNGEACSRLCTDTLTPCIWLGQWGSKQTSRPSGAGQGWDWCSITRPCPLPWHLFRCSEQPGPANQRLQRQAVPFIQGSAEHEANQISAATEGEQQGWAGRQLLLLLCMHWKLWLCPAKHTAL